MPPDLSVVIVSWNTRDLTLSALSTLFADVDAHGPSAEVWVVDCASSDGTPEAVSSQFPRTRLIASPRNLGFAAGNNAALRAIGFPDHPGGGTLPADLPSAVYFLNPDTETLPGATRTLFDALHTLPGAGVVGAQLEYGDGGFQHSAFRFPGVLQALIDLFPVAGRWQDSRLNGRYPRAIYEAGLPFPVDHTLGAAMMLRREAILDTGLFDEGYFMYSEEIDWSLRIRRAGWQIYAVPSARVTHFGGQSTRQTRPESLVNLWRSRLQMYRKHYSRATVLAVRALLWLGMQRAVVRARRQQKAGDLSAAECAALVSAYRTVQKL